MALPPENHREHQTHTQLHRIKTFISNNKTFLAALFAYTIIALLVFGTALNHDFVVGWDDDLYVLNNQAVNDLSLNGIGKAFTEFYVGNYAPVQILSYMVDHVLWGMDPAGFILTNILLHIANAILFYLLIDKISGNSQLAFAAPLIFLVHPLQVESVVWISQRKTLLSMLFFLLAFHQYVKYRDDNPERVSPPYFASLAYFVLAIASKPVAVVFPLAAYCYDLFCCRRNKSRGELFDKIPFIVIAAGMVLLSVKSQSPAFSQGGMGGPYMQGGGLSPLHGGSSYATFLTMIPVMAGYLNNFFFPAYLSAIYLPDIKTGWDATVIISTLILAIIMLFGVLLHRNNRRMFFWYLMFFIGLLPVSQIIPLVTLMNDRYMYFPMLGISVLTCSAVMTGASCAGGRTPGSIIKIFVLLLAVVSLAFVSFNRSAVWKNSYTLWKDTAQKLPHVASVHFKLGTERLRSGFMDEAIQELRLSIKLDPSLVEARYNLGVAYANQALLDEAELEFREALAINPDFAEVHFARGEIFMAKGVPAKALESFKAALALNPYYAQARHRAGIACMRLGLYEEALRYLEAAVRIAPGDREFSEDLAAFHRMKRSGTPRKPERSGGD